MPTYDLHYFGLHGRAEPIRLLLHKSGADWKDTIVSNWGEVKNTYPGGQVPCLILEDGTRMGESVAIARFVAQRHGMYPDDPVEALAVDEYLHTWSEFFSKTYPPAFASDDTKAAKIETAFAAAEQFIKAYDTEFAKGGWLVGNRFTAADAVVGAYYFAFFNNPSVGFEKARFEALLVKYPNFKAYGERVAAEFKDYPRGTTYSC